MYTSRLNVPKQYSDNYCRPQRQRTIQLRCDVRHEGALVDGEQQHASVLIDGEDAASRLVAHRRENGALRDALGEQTLASLPKYGHLCVTRKTTNEQTKIKDIARCVLSRQLHTLAVARVSCFAQNISQTMDHNTSAVNMGDLLDW